MADPVSIPPPNYTQIPNAILDLMADMSNAEFRVVMAIARQTFGWHKKRDKISLTQLQTLTGMSRQGVVDGVTVGVERGVIERTPDASDGRGGIWYRLLVNDVDQSSTLTSQGRDQSTSLTRTSQRTRPELVNDVDTQKKGKKRKENDGDGDRAHVKKNGARPPQHVAYLASQGMGAAAEFSSCDPDSCIADFDARRADGIPIGVVTNQWRISPPHPGVIYERRSLQPETPPNRARRSAVATYDTDRDRRELARLERQTAERLARQRAAD